MLFLGNVRGLKLCLAALVIVIVGATPYHYIDKGLHSDELYFAVVDGDLEKIKVLISKGERVDHISRDSLYRWLTLRITFRFNDEASRLGYTQQGSIKGATPFHASIFSRRYMIFEYFLYRYGDGIKDGDGESISDYVLRCGDEKAVSIYRRWLFEVSHP